jgi:acyl carrier protein
MIIRWLTTRQAEMNGAEIKINADTDLLAGGLLDSLDFLHLITFIEDEYSVQIPVELLAPENFATARVAGETVENINAAA